jgi:MFS family permease
MGDLSPSGADIAGDPGAPQPTWVRWRVVGLLMAYAAMCHFNRISITVAGAEKIIPEQGVDPVSMGAVYSAYLSIYTLCMTTGGWLIDRWGPKVALALMGFASAIGVALTGIAGMVFTVTLIPALLVIRGLTGAVNAPMHPGAARMVSFWVPLPTRAWANGLVTAAACVGIAGTYVGFGFLMEEFGWPTAFVICAVATAVLALVWTTSVTDQPAGRVTVVSDGPDPGRISLLRNRSLISLTISYGAVGYFQYLFFYWMEYYFQTVLGLGKEHSRLASTVCTLAMGVGMIVGGWLADWLQKRLGTRVGRPIVPVGGLLISAVLLGLGIMTSDQSRVIAYFALALAAVGACEGPFWITAVDLGGRRGGASAAICNTGGNLGGLVAPVLTPFLSELANWQAAISVGCLVCLAGAAQWWWIDPTERCGL